MAIQSLLKDADSFFQELEARVVHPAQKQLTSITPGFTGARGFTGWIDSFNERREPTIQDLARELKNTAWMCASINSSTCASFPPRLFVQTGPMLPQPIKGLQTRALCRDEIDKLKACNPWLKTNEAIQEILDHPYLRLIRNVNPLMNQQELLELTTFYQEIFGVCYWYVVRDAFNLPIEIWPFSAFDMIPAPIRRQLDPNNLAYAFTPEYYDLVTMYGTMRIEPSFIIEFRYPDPRNPYRGGIGPMRAAFESITLNSEFLAHKQALWQNRARPDAILAPEEMLGESERERIEQEFNDKFRRGGAGKLLVTETPIRLMPLSWPLNETALLAEHGVTKEDICNAFGVPLSFVTKETNMANLQASDALYMGKAIRPRLNRRDEKITERLLPFYDPSGRLIAMSEDPVPEDVAAEREQERVDLEHGTLTINEVRHNRGLQPVPWGQIPWLPTYFAPADPNNPNRNVYDRTGYGGYAKPPFDKDHPKPKKSSAKKDKEAA